MFVPFSNLSAPPPPHIPPPPSLHDLPPAILREVSNYLLPGSVVRGLAAAGPVPLRHLGHTDLLANLAVDLVRRPAGPDNYATVQLVGMPPAGSRLDRLRRLEVRESAAMYTDANANDPTPPDTVNELTDAVILALNQGGGKLESLKLLQEGGKHNVIRLLPTDAHRGPRLASLSRVLAAAPSMCPVLRELELEGNMSTHHLVENDQGAAWRCIFEQCPLLARLKLVRVRSLTDAGMAAIAEAGAKKGALRSLHVEACACISPAGWDHFAGAGLRELAVGWPFENRGSNCAPRNFLPRICPDTDTWESWGRAVAGAAAQCEKLTLEVLIPVGDFEDDSDDITDDGLGDTFSWVKGYKAALDALFGALDAPRLTALVVGDGIAFDGGDGDIDGDGDAFTWFMRCEHYEGDEAYLGPGMRHSILFPSLLKWMREARCGLQTLKLQGYQNCITDFEIGLSLEMIRGAFAHHSASLTSLTLQLPRQDADEAGGGGFYKSYVEGLNCESAERTSLPLDIFEAIFQPLAELVEVRCGVEEIRELTTSDLEDELYGLDGNGELLQSSKIDVLSLFCTKLRRVALTPIGFGILLHPYAYQYEEDRPNDFVNKLNECSASLLNLVGRCHEYVLQRWR